MDTLWYREARSGLLLVYAVIGLMLFGLSLKKRKYFAWRLLGGTAAGFFLMRLIGHRIYIVGSSSVLAMLSHAAVSVFAYFFLIAIALFCFDESIWTVVFTASSGYLIQDIAGSLKTIVRIAPAADRFSSTGPGALTLDICGLALVCVLVMWLLKPYILERNDNFDNRLKAIFSVIVLLICVGMARLTQDNPDRDRMAILAESLFQLLVDVLILALQFGVMEHAKLNAHVETMRELVHQQRAQYEASKESAQLINEKYHDLKHLLKSFSGTVPQEQLDKLKQSIAAYERPANSGNEVLDVLLAEKIGICQQKDIVLTCSLGMTDFSFVEELDLYSLFQNALNNAINAVSALPEDVERFITLSAMRDGNMLSIHMENPCREDIVFENGQPVTTGDPRWHGFGMKSMARTAEKYNGLLTSQVKDGLFLLDILLLAPEKSGEAP